MAMGIQPPVLPEPMQGMRKPGPSPAAAATGMNGFYGGIQNPGGPAAMLGMGGQPPDMMQMMGGGPGAPMPGGPAQQPGMGQMGQPGMGPPPDQMPGQVQPSGVPQMTEADMFLRIVAQALGMIGGGGMGGQMGGMGGGMAPQGGMGGMPPGLAALMGGQGGAR